MAPFQTSEGGGYADERQRAFNREMLRRKKKKEKSGGGGLSEQGKRNRIMRHERRYGLDPGGLTWEQRANNVRTMNERNTYVIGHGQKAKDLGMDGELHPFNKAEDTAQGAKLTYKHIPDLIKPKPPQPQPQPQPQQSMHPEADVYGGQAPWDFYSQQAQPQQAPKQQLDLRAIEHMNANRAAMGLPPLNFSTDKGFTQGAMPQAPQQQPVAQEPVAQEPNAQEALAGEILGKLAKQQAHVSQEPGFSRGFTESVVPGELQEGLAKDKSLLEMGEDWFRRKGDPLGLGYVDSPEQLEINEQRELFDELKALPDDIKQILGLSDEVFVEAGKDLDSQDPSKRGWGEYLWDIGKNLEALMVGSIPVVGEGILDARGRLVSELGEAASGRETNFLGQGADMAGGALGQMALMGLGAFGPKVAGPKITSLLNKVKKVSNKSPVFQAISKHLEEAKARKKAQTRADELKSGREKELEDAAREQYTGGIRKKQEKAQERAEELKQQAKEQQPSARQKWEAQQKAKQKAAEADKQKNLDDARQKNMEIVNKVRKLNADRKAALQRGDVLEAHDINIQINDLELSRSKLRLPRKARPTKKGKPDKKVKVVVKGRVGKGRGDSSLTYRDRKATSVYADKKYRDASDFTSKHRSTFRLNDPDSRGARLGTMSERSTARRQESLNKHKNVLRRIENAPREEAIRIFEAANNGTLPKNFNLKQAIKKLRTGVQNYENDLKKLPEYKGKPTRTGLG